LLRLRSDPFAALSLRNPTIPNPKKRPNIKQKPISFDELFFPYLLLPFHKIIKNSYHSKRRKARRNKKGPTLLGL
jgi:hypothetical protein